MKTQLCTLVLIVLMTFACASDDTEDRETGAVTISQLELTTSESGSSASFQVSLTTEPSSDVVLEFSSLDPGEVEILGANNNILNLTFTDSNGTSPWNQPLTVEVRGLDDNLADGNQTAIINITLASQDTDYRGLNPPNVRVTNSDNDTAGFTVSPQSLAAVEGSNQLTLSIRPNTQPTNPVTISISSTDETEATVSPSILTWDSDWSVEKQVNVTIIDDEELDGAQSFSINLSPESLDEAYSAIPGPSIPITVADNDTAGISISQMAIVLNEGGASQQIRLKPNTQPQPGSTIVLTPTNLDSTEVDIQPQSLSWNQNDWQQEKLLVLNPVDDTIADGNQNFTIDLQTSNSSDTDYRLIVPPSLDLTVIDNEVAGFVITPQGNISVRESEKVTITIRPSTQPAPNENIRISISTTDSTEGIVSLPNGAELSWTDADWQTDKTIEITGVVDSLDDGDQEFSLIIDASSSVSEIYSASTPLSISMTTVDINSMTVFSRFTCLAREGSSSIISVRPSLRPLPGETIRIDVRSLNLDQANISPSFRTWTERDWNTLKRFTFTPIDDLYAENTQIVRVNYAISANGTKVNSVTRNCNISDNDTAGFTLDPITPNLQLIESRLLPSSKSFTIHPNTIAKPGNEITINLIISDTTEATTSTTALVWTNSDGQSPKTITVFAKDDLVKDGTQPFTLTLDPSGSSETFYRNLDPIILNGSTADNESIF